ncbi:MAG: nucleotidyltransferase domain-containing protein [Planctomycetes bacterium]|jgi:hypothetical protein|nr:nucleotidyltransferase domain-containing protein [Planctomycetota bacterium]
MVAMNEIEPLGRRIGEGFGAEKVILFGSCARGTAGAESDVDLLVVARTALPPQKRYGAVRRLRADCPAGFDIVVLVDFEEGAEPGLWETSGIQEELSQLLRRPVDLVERKAVESSENYIRRRHILDTAETIYVAG